MKYLRNPLFWFIGALFVLFLRDVYFVLTDQEIGRGSSLETLFLYYPIACWVYLDARRRKIYFPSDWVMIFMILFFPAYMYRSRGWKGLGILLLWVLGLGIYAWFEYQILYLLQQA